MLKARNGAPEAIQVADRWHLIDNLADGLEVFFRSKGTCLKAAAAALARKPEEAGQPQTPSDKLYQGKRRHPKPPLARARHETAAEAGVARRREKHDQVCALHARGAGVTEITRTVGIAKMTVYRYLREGPPQRKRHRIHGKQRVLEPWEPYLLKRWAEGCRMATRLWREIQAQGFAYSLTNVQRFVAELRREGPSPTGQPRIATATELADDFLVMLRWREGARLPAWLDAAEESGVEDLARFARKLRTDLAAVQAGLTLRQSNGQTEGQVNRLKLLKRQAYGREDRPAAQAGAPGGVTTVVSE